VVVATEGANLDAEALRRWLAGRVARWWIPERWVFVDDIPRTSVGKIDKKLMRARYAARQLDVIEVTAPLPRNPEVGKTA
jgi:fatty-acyl-CoA synthase